MGSKGGGRSDGMEGRKVMGWKRGEVMGESNRLGTRRGKLE